MPTAETTTQATALLAAQEGAGTLVQGVADNSDRLPGHIDSWIALAIIVSSLAIAWALNNEKPAVRMAGTFLAALGCFAVAAWFVAVLSTGIVDHPKPAVIPVDAAKPALLWLQALAAAGAGLFLLIVTFWQSKRRDVLALPVRNESDRYGRLSRYLHWTTAILFLALLPMGLFASMIPEQGFWFRQGYYVVHKTLGFTVLGLVLVRIVWNVMSPRPKLDPSLRKWESRLAHGVHVFFYALLIAFPVTGFVMSTYGGKLSHFFIWDTPLPWAKDLTAIIPWALAHKVILPYLAFVAIAAHVLGALKHRFIDGHSQAFRRMVS